MWQLMSALKHELDAPESDSLLFGMDDLPDVLPAGSETVEEPSAASPVTPSRAERHKMHSGLSFLEHVRSVQRPRALRRRRRTRTRKRQ